MILLRLAFLVVTAAGVAAVLFQWNMAVGFNALDARWWTWLFKAIKATGGNLPRELTYPLWWTGAAMVSAWAVMIFIAQRPSTRTVGGGTDARNTHGSSRWATWRDVVKSGLVDKHGAVVGGFKRAWKTVMLLHDGPEHILAFAPTRSGKGVALVITTLLTWLQSVLVLDIKGENYALTAGWRKLIGQRVIKFDPSNIDGSARYNPLAEIRAGTDHEMADCQNIASIIIDPDAKGLKDYFLAAGWEWLSAVILHVVYRVQRDDGRTATLADVHEFMSIGEDDGDDELSNADDNFDRLLDDMMRFEHGRESVNRAVRRAAAQMHKKAPNERSGVHSSANVQLALYSDPIVARNISECDFRIADLMNGEQPTSLYIVIPPSEIQRMRPLIRIILNQFLTRLTSHMEFEGGATKKHYKHKLLLMLDEFTSIGKLEIFEKALAYMAGYGLKAFIIVQDTIQLQKEYGRDESITSNCHVRIAYAPNKTETAEVLSKMTGKTTLQQRKRSKSYGKGGSVSDSVSEVARPLMTADECMSMPGIRKGPFGRVKPGDMLIFVAGHRPIYGRQILYFQDKVLKKRAAIPAPGAESPAIDAGDPSPASAHTPVVEPLSYEAVLSQVEKAET